ncbi:trans-sulfuration enzyme family protein [Arcticibacter tournemirensis]|uniref:PLP-dependent transferase n=2 Tax=Pseudomonadati TaxID=3379134 RepID=A0A4Q0MCS7_9SPHI|nr:PLP-dependent aspartate aminotransferase family protein [Arcticibacter tournemirensis]RXF71167.1 PLP-dependent transferase [Arcticibacter tournemirensis]
MSENTPFPVGQNTTAIHAGETPDSVTKASAPNIVMSTTFLTEADAGFSVEEMNEDTGWVYTRWGNPTVHQLEEKIAALEGTESAVAFGSGMSAISALLFHTLHAGDHAIISDVAYAALAEMTNGMLPSLGVNISKVNTSDPSAIENALTAKTRLIYVETPCNPLLRLTDISAVSTIARKAGVLLAVDSTFATPVATRPIELGADFVIHSLTKYLGGHGDALGGVIAGKKESLAELRKNTAIRLGGVISPFNAWLIMRGIATFPLRMKAHAENAIKVAEYLEGHPRIRKVIYPGLPSHPQYELACRQMRNFSGMITFQIDNGDEMAKQLSARLQIIHYAVSLGHHRSLIFYMRSEDLLLSSFKLETQERKDSWDEFAGKGIFRLSVGLEDAEDIIRDLDNALK